jgi:hypothetical protein
MLRQLTSCLRLLLIGYFEGLDATRAIVWRAADSFAVREVLGLVLPEAPPDHSTISRTRRLIDLERHEAVFTWMLWRVADAGLVKGKTVSIDATMLEANAALRSIVRRDTGDSWSISKPWAFAATSPNPSGAGGTGRSTGGSRRGLLQSSTHSWRARPAPAATPRGALGTTLCASP